MDWAARRHLVMALGLCLLTLAAYSNSFGAGFAMDNRGLILQDARVRAVTAENIDLIFQHTYWWPYGESGLFRPLTTLSYLFNYAVLGNGEQPGGYHWTNFLLHACNVLLVYALAFRLTPSTRPAWIPGGIAALWAVHPVLTESVTNIVGRADLLAGMSVLAGLLLYLKSTETAGWQRVAYLAALFATTAIGVFSKESAVTVLPVIVLFEALWWKERRQALGLVLGSIAMLVPIQAMLYQRAAVLWNAGPTRFPFYDNPIVGLGPLTGRLTALMVMGKYVALLAWPARLSCDYSWAQIPPVGGSGGADWLAWVALFALCAAGVLLSRRSRLALFLSGSAFLVFLPTSNLLFPIGTIMAERFLYLPAIAFAAGVVAAAAWAGARVDRRFAPALVGVLIIFCAVRTWARNLDWQDDLTVGRAAVSVSPDSFKSHKLLAYALHEADPSGNNDRVIEESEKGLVPLNQLPDSRNNADSYLRTGGYYAERGERLRQSGAAGSEAAYRRALELLMRSRKIAESQTAGAADPARFGPLLLRISEAHRRLGEREAALDSAMEGRRMDPGNTELHHQIAAILLDQKRTDEAAAALMEGVIVTTDNGLRDELLRLYQAGLDTMGCATMLVQGHTALNPACPTVKRHLCAASLGTIALRMETGRQDLAEAMRQTAIKDFGCKPEDLQGAK